MIIEDGSIAFPPLNGGEMESEVLLVLPPSTLKINGGMADGWPTERERDHGHGASMRAHRRMATKEKKICPQQNKGGDKLRRRFLI